MDSQDKFLKEKYTRRVKGNTSQKWKTCMAHPCVYRIVRKKFCSYNQIKLHTHKHVPCTNVYHYSSCAIRNKGHLETALKCSRFLLSNYTECVRKVGRIFRWLPSQSLWFSLLCPSDISTKTIPELKTTFLIVLLSNYNLWILVKSLLFYNCNLFVSLILACNIFCGTISSI